MSRYSWAVGLEDQDVSDVDLTALEDPQNGVEANSIECAEATNDLDTLQQDGEQLAGDTTQLEEIADAVESAEADGGMDETAARVVDVAVESIAQRWGIRRNKIGLENFSGANKSRGTSVALESIVDTLKEMWQRFAAWVGEIVAKLKDFWLKYFNAGKSLQNRADKLEARLNKGVGERSKDQIGGSWVEKLAINGTVSIKEVQAYAGKYASNNKAVAALDKLLTSTKQAIADGKTLDATVADVTDCLGYGVKTTKSFKAAIPSEAKVYDAIAYPGGHYGIIYGTDTADTKSIGIKVIQVNEITGEKKLSTPDTAAMYDAIKSIRQIGEALEEAIKDFRPVNDHLAQLRDKAKSAADTLKDSQDTKRDAARGSLRTANQAVSNFLAVKRVLSTCPLDAANGLVGYVQAGLAAYKPVKA